MMNDRDLGRNLAREAAIAKLRAGPKVMELRKSWTYAQSGYHNVMTTLRPGAVDAHWIAGLCEQNESIDVPELFDLATPAPKPWSEPPCVELNLQCYRCEAQFGADVGAFTEHMVWHEQTAAKPILAATPGSCRVCGLASCMHPRDLNGKP